MAHDPRLEDAPQRNTVGHANDRRGRRKADTPGAQVGAGTTTGAPLAGRDPRAVPAWVDERFIRVDNRYHFPDQTLAFTDQGRKLRTRSHNAEVVRSLVAIAQERGWTAVRVKGSAEFRHAVWREASLRGIEVHGYRASAVEREALRRELARRPAPETPPAGPQAARDNAGAQADVTGRLLEAGHAHYRFDPARGQSYFVRVQTAQGERTLWGVDLERALVESRSAVKVGDEVTVRRLGDRAVTLQAPRHDQTGQPAGREPLTTRRATWQVETTAFIERQAAKAQAFLDGSRPRAALVQEHSDLTGAVVALWLGEQFAARHIERPEDRQRVVALVRQRLAEAVERGEAIDTPRMRKAVARDLDGVEDRSAPGDRRDPVRHRARSARAQDHDIPPQARL